MKTVWTYDASNRTERKHVRKFNTYTLAVAFVILMAVALVLSLVVMLLDKTSPDMLVFFSFLGRATALNALMIGLLALAILTSLGRQSVTVEIHLDDLSVLTSDEGAKVTYTVAYKDIKKIYIDKVSKSALWQSLGGGYFIMFESVRESVNGEEPVKVKRRRNFPVMESLEEAQTVVAFIEERREKAKNS
ncbi:MAG: hypothetical protein IJC52_03920 [Clostridia bacterium]|nr:hypothetical protein [Clostridia bacterium]